MTFFPEIDTFWNNTPEGVNKIVKSALEEINAGSEIIRLGLKVIAHKSYGRIYLRWQHRGNKDRKANFKDFEIPLTLPQDLALSLYQARIDRLNAQIAFYSKQHKQSHRPKPT